MIIKSLAQYQREPDSITLVLAGREAPWNVPETSIGQDLQALDVKPGKTEVLKSVRDGKVNTALYARLPEELDYDAVEELTADVLQQLKALKAACAQVLVLEPALVEWSFGVYMQLLLAGNSFDRFKTTGIAAINLEKEADPREAFQPEFIVYLPEGSEIEKEQQKLAMAEQVAEGIRITRRLVNEPANIMTPEQLAREALALGKEHGFEVEVFDEKQIQQMGMEAFYSVAKGSDAPPRFMVMRYMNKPDSREVLALVGKGLTYDSGGYALKPAEGMGTMFCDMGGAGAVIGAISTLAAMKARVNVVAIVAACENMISGQAYHNGDIIGSLAGKYIEVVNTDAEGRLTLADAIAYAATVIKADWIVDIATLTGAVSVALGKEITGVVADDETVYSALARASQESGDKIWRLPHYDLLAKHNKSERADIKNSGGRQAGTATAALFCRAFAFGKPWGHLDIAGTAYQDKSTAKAPAGATGVGAELLARAAIALFE